MHWIPLHVQQVIAAGLFFLVYYAIATEKIERAKAALFGATILLMLRIVTQAQAFGEEGSRPLVEWNVIFLLSGMMIIVTILSKTGVFEWLAIKSVHLSKASPPMLFAILCLVTAFASMFLDNVTTVILIAPVSITIARTLRIDPIPLLIGEVIASNVGGTATLIGDPPNIIIGSYADIGFNPFLLNLAPVALLALFITTAVSMFWLSRHQHVGTELRRMAMETDASAAIKDPKLLKQGLFVLGITIAGFVLHGMLQVEPATVALFGAALLMLISTQSAEELLESIEWSTIFFFLGLFILVGALVQVGLIDMLAHEIYKICGHDVRVLSMVFLWFSAAVSGLVDNIPYVTTMCPVVVDIAKDLYPHVANDIPSLMHHPDVMVLWWSLGIGACFGGNATLIGASANVVVAGIADHEGHPITFGRFLKFGLPLTALSLVVATIYIWLRYLIFM